MSRSDLIARAGGAFDAKWLAAAEDGARVDRRQLTNLAALLEVDPSDITLPEDDRPPYRGLLAFESYDADLFGGRETATQKILDLVDHHPITAVIGASGSGKSSVVKAGVIARLQTRRDPSWRVLALRPGADPLLALARALGSEVDRDANETVRIERSRERATALFNGTASLSDFTDRIVELRTTKGAPPPRLVVFIDQWEEIYTQIEDCSRRRVFLEQISAAFVKGPHRLIFTMRADFTGHLLEDQRAFFDAVEPGMIALPRMTTNELASSIRKPAEVVGLRFETGLVEAILNDAGDEPGVLALVEFTLTQLWEKRDKDQNRMTLAAYHAIGGLNGAIDRHADSVFARLSPDQQSAASGALTKLVHVSTLDSYTRARRPLSEFGDEAQAVIRALAEQDTRLVVISYDEEFLEYVAEVSHEALIREWKKLHDWVAADPQFLQWNDAIERRWRRYEKSGRRDDDLLMGSELDEAQSWLRTRGMSVAIGPESQMQGEQANQLPTQTGSWAGTGDISREVRDFINASEAKRERVEEERKQTQKRQLADARAIAMRTRMGLVAALALALLAAGFGTYAQNERGRAEAALVRADTNYKSALQGSAGIVDTIRKQVSAGGISTRLAVNLLRFPRQTVEQLQTKMEDSQVLSVEWRLFDILSEAYVALPGQGESAHSMALREVSLAKQLSDGQPAQADYVEMKALSDLNLGISYDILDRLDKALAADREALNYLTGITTTPSRQRSLSKIHERLGDVLDKKQDFNGALSEYTEMLRLTEGLSKLPAPDPDWIRGLALAHERMGDVARDLGNLKLATDEYRDYESTAQRLVALAPANEPEVTWQLDLAIAEQRLGDVFLEQKQYQDALDKFEKYEQAASDAVKRDPEEGDWLRYLANSHIEIGDVHFGRGNFSAARGEYEKAVPIYENLISRDGNRASWQRNRAIAYDRLGNALQQMGKLTDALSAYRKCLSVPAPDDAGDHQLTKPRLVHHDCQERADSVAAIH